MTNRNVNEAPIRASVDQGSGGEASPSPVSPERGTKAQEDSPAEAQGRRILSKAFVWVGPDGYLTVELHDGRVLVLRDVVMRRSDYCGRQAAGGVKGTQYCGGYADVASARPGGGPATLEPGLSASEAPGSPRPGSNSGCASRAWAGDLPGCILRYR